MRIADEAQGRFGKTVSWGAQAGDRRVVLAGQPGDLDDPDDRYSSADATRGGVTEGLNGRPPCCSRAAVSR